MSISSADRKRLWGRAHNQCAHPQCRTQLTQVGNGGDDEPDVIGEEAHVRSPRSGGPRYDPAHPRAKLDRYENLILLCPTHHSWADTGDGRNLSVDEMLRMKRDHERRGQVADRIDRTVRAYLSHQYGADDKILFERVELNGPSVDSLFVDVPMAAPAFTDAGQFLDEVHAGDPGDADLLDESEEWAVAGAAQALLHPAWTGNAMIIGGPGQGKSTLLQYVCQFHRSRLLNREEYRGPADGLRTTTAEARVPIRIDLRRYAAWPGRHGEPRNEPGGTSVPRSNRSLELYLAEHIDEHAGHTGFTAADLLELVASQPVVLALDGLDEVASAATRDEVSQAILDTARRLAGNAYDLVVLVTTRPGTSNAALWNSPEFPRFHLQKLTPGLRHLYLDRWVRQASLNPERAQTLRNVFLENESAPHVRDLASNPMQLAIVLHLLHKRGLLPQERTELYANYVETFLDREDDKEPLVKNERDLIEDVHAFIAWNLHARAELGDTSGVIDIDDLRRDLATYLAEHSSKDRLFVDELFDALTGRVICLIERITGSGVYEFEVQSLREYFAARYVFQHVLPNRPRGGATRDDALNALLARPYWSNVFRFLVGMLSKGEIRASLDNLRTLKLSRQVAAPHPHARAAAALLLEDRVYRTQPSSVFRGAAELLLDGAGIVLVEDDAFGTAQLTLTEGAGREEARDHLVGRLATEHHREVRRALATAVLRHEHPQQLARWWWEQRTVVAPFDWLATAADLRVLTDVPEDRLDEIGRIVIDAAAHATDSEPICLLLSRAGLATANDAIAGVCVAEIADGRLGTVAAQAETSFVWELVRDADAVVQALTPHVSTPVAPTRRRVRRRRAGAVPPAIASTRSATDAVRAMASSDDHSAWRAALSAVEAAWGDSWVLRCSVVAAPSPHVNTGSSTAAATGLDQVIEFVATARARRDDPAWWRAASPTEPVRDLLDARTWLLTALLFAPARTLCELGTEISTLADGLTPSAARALRKALLETAGMRGGALDMRDAIRVGKTQLSPVAAALLRPLVHDSTRLQLDKIIAEHLGDLFTSGLADEVALDVAGSTGKRMDPTPLRNARGRIGPREWNPSIVLKTLSRPRATDILRAPHEWPAPVVMEAVRKATDDLANQEPLADVAASEDWFSQ